jgi:type II secretory pathway pseudopilin PulG
MKPAARRSAFTALEIVLAIAILVILVGAAVPVTSKLLTYRATSATHTELQGLSEASAEFFRDTRRLPNAITELLVDPHCESWSGPYLPSSIVDAASGKSIYEVDAWSRAYSLAASGDVLTITARARIRSSAMPTTCRSI